MSAAWFERDGEPTTQVVRVKSEHVGVVMFEHPCSRCGGAGRSDKWAYTGFTCYDCGGSGFRGRMGERKVYSAEKLTKLNATRAKAQAKAQAKRDAIAQERKVAAALKLADFQAANADLLVSARRFEHPILADCLSRLTLYGEWSEGQIAMVRRIVAECETKAAQVNEYIGKVGERYEFEGICEYSISLESNSQWARYFYIAGIRTHRGLVVYKGSRCPFVKGDSYKFAATVKGHDTYKGTPQTIVERVKVHESEEASVADTRNMPLTASDFEQATGHPPQQDDLDRANCAEAGSMGHRGCGICTHGLPVFVCHTCFASDHPVLRNAPEASR